jgi:hypothetical protein
MKTLQSRHWAFAGLFLVVTILMLLNIKFKAQISPDTQKMFDYIESLPEGSTIIVSFDHEASSLPEMRPLGLAILRHAFARNHKLIGVALLAEGTGIGYRLLQLSANESGKKYGTDYVFLGFKPQYIAAILSMGESIESTFPEDYIGHKSADLPLLDRIQNYENVSGVISLADGSLTTHWIEYGRARYGIEVSAAVAAAMVTTYDPYLSSGQLRAIVGGLRGAAEYESLINRGGSGSRGMLAQSWAHIYIIALIIIGNVAYFRARKKGGQS